MQQSSAAQAVKLNEVRLRDEVAEYSKVKKKGASKKRQKIKSYAFNEKVFLFLKK